MMGASPLLGRFGQEVFELISISRRRLQAESAYNCATGLMNYLKGRYAT